MNDREALPDVDIAAGQDRLTFVKRMVSIAESEPGMTVELHQDTFGNEGLHFANFFLPGFSENIRSGGQLIVRPGEARISIEMRSADWQADHPTRNEYITFCKEVFSFLASAYSPRH